MPMQKKKNPDTNLNQLILCSKYSLYLSVGVLYNDAWNQYVHKVFLGQYVHKLIL